LREERKGMRMSRRVGERVGRRVGMGNAHTAYLMCCGGSRDRRIPPLSFSVCLHLPPPSLLHAKPNFHLSKVVIGL